MTFPLRALLPTLALTALVRAQSPLESGATVTFGFGAPTVVLSTQDMDRNGLLFPDGTLGFTREPGTDRYDLWGAGGGLGGVSARARPPAGSYAFSGTLGAFGPAVRDRHGPAASVYAGTREPSPDGSDFDRDYAGGGPTYRLDRAGAAGRVCGPDARRVPGVAPPLLLQIYHGEFRLGPAGLPAYGGSGMAVSCDGGAHFAKLGRILSPHLTRREFAASGRRGGLWADGAMVEAHGSGRAPDGGSCATGADCFYYLLFTDHNGVDEHFTGLSVARIPQAELLSAVGAGHAPAFRKYYNPGAMVSFDAAHFSEPGIGGRSTPILFVPGEHINTPAILYDTYLKRFVLCYQVNQKEVMLRVSSDLQNWSPETVAFSLETSAVSRVFYPSMAGVGFDPQLPGRIFYLYFLVREQSAGRGFADPRLLRQLVSIAP